MPHQAPAQTRQFADLIGNTPLIYLRGVSEMTGCHIYGKAEFLNPGGSVKDRTALGIVRAAESSGELQPGGTIVEGTAGNTGIGLTLLANSLGYKSVVVMPQSLSKEKIELLDLYGADLRLVKATSYDDPNHYIHTAERLAKELSAKDPNGVVWARQFDNTANRDIHYQTTGAEIWEQTNGKVDGFICAVGTGGTLAGTAMALRERNSDIKIGIADPQGSALFNHYVNGELKAEGRSIAEGIGISFVTGNLEGIDIDMPFQISDAEALPHIFDILRHEGLCLGGSSAVNIAGAVRMAKEMGPGHTLVTILCDYGDRYKSKLYNPVYLEQVDLPVPNWLRV
ncbi:cysteine synthase A [Litorivivens lipolytica]|uniref:cysteine synthase n=1 Tax=Litorivivens lipolytica TaxID=1524264 RepID=A0A7W4W6F0_9GAMM|nr:cysteine synthase A [Litorivivens lipolytica]MBB3048294.1 cysteine synthase A [Litorivivens lipolytica]